MSDQKPRTEAEIAAEHRAAYIASLREIAQFLEDNPEVPVYRYGPGLSFGVNYDEDEEAAIERVRKMAHALGVEVSHRGRQWRANRQFGIGEYGCSYVERAEMDEYRAAQSYMGRVDPERAR